MVNLPWLALIGPAGAGKSTLGELAAHRTGRVFVDLDGVAEPYYAEVGWSLDKLRDRIAIVGRAAAETEWEPARAHAVTRIVDDHPDTILALGAGHTSYTDPANFAVVRTALGRCAHVVLVHPSPDRDTSLAVLRERCLASKGSTWIVNGHDFLAAWLDDPATRQVATHVLHTGANSPEATVDRLLALIAK
ncbi:MAG TPA: shikimate kinase [Pseudonocardiaceae bacterium]